MAEPITTGSDPTVGERATAQSISVVVPTVNEADNIDELLDAVLLNCRDTLDVQVIVVDDGSSDGTRDIVRAWEPGHPVRLLARDPKGGLAVAVLAGAAVATSDVVVVMDADLSHPPERIPDLARPVLDGSKDMVIGSRYVPGGSTPDWPWRRRIASRAAAGLAWPLADVRDPMSGFFAVRRERLLDVDPDADGFKIGLEVLVRGGDSLRVAEVPIEFRDRTYGSSKFGPKQVFSYVNRLRTLAGGAVSGRSALRFGIVGLVGLVVDLVGFHALFSAGSGLAMSHTVSFLAATVVNYWLNARWSFAGAAAPRQGRRRVPYLRFLAICLMAFFLAWFKSG